MTEISRRKFIQLSVIGSAVAASGCEIKPLTRYQPGVYRAEVTGQYGGYDNRVYPYLNQPDGLMDGVPQYFATVCRMCPAGCGLFVRTMGGRAVKIEGNPAHPVNRGATCARAQSALQHLYNPDRLRGPVLHAERGAVRTRERGNAANPPDGRKLITDIVSQPTNWGAALEKVSSELKSAKGKIAILADAQEFSGSPTLGRQLQQFAQKTQASVFTYSLLDDAPWRAAAKAAYGHDQLPAYQLDEADLIVSFGGDFLEAWPSPVFYSRLFGEFRQGPRRAQGEHGRFIYIGPRMSMTAAKADTWLPCNPGTESVIAQAIADVLHDAKFSLTDAAATSGLSVEQLQMVAQDFRNAGTRAVAIGGNGLLTSPNATAAFTVVELLNKQVKSQCVGFGSAAIPLPNFPGAGFKNIQQLVRSMQSGQVGALLILGQPNPVFTLPNASGFLAAMQKVPFVAALTPFEDETTAWANVVLPTRTFLEDWGDHVPPVIPMGMHVATLQQPIIDPQFVGGDGINTLDPPVSWMDTRPLADLLVDLAARLGKPLTDSDSHSAVRTTWAMLGQADLKSLTTNNDPSWVAALSKGGLWQEVSSPPQLGGGREVGRAGASPAPTSPTPQNWGEGASYALHLYPQIYNHDGRHANLGWMQENPDPMTMAVWNSWVEINMQVAHELGIRTGDIIRLTSAHGSIDVPAIPYPGLHPGAVAMPIGQGHTLYGRNAEARGVNPLAILDPTTDTVTGALALGATRVRITKIASAQSGYQIDGSTLVLAQDRPGGAEPEAVKDLIHTTAKEWKTAKPVTGAPKIPGSIFNRKSETEAPTQ